MQVMYKQIDGGNYSMVASDIDVTVDHDTGLAVLEAFNEHGNCIGFAGRVTQFEFINLD